MSTKTTEKTEREKDAEIAAWLFGWKFQDGPTAGEVEITASPCDAEGLYIRYGVRWMDDAGIPRFCDDPGAMIALIEAMRAKGWQFQLWSALGGFGASFGTHTDAGATPMAAVAAAALGALPGRGA